MLINFAWKLSKSANLKKVLPYLSIYVFLVFILLFMEVREGM